MSELKTKWPAVWGGYPTVEDMRDYERARAEAAISFLQEAMHLLSLVHGESDTWYEHRDVLIAAILPIPGEQT